MKFKNLYQYTFKKLTILTIGFLTLAFFLLTSLSCDKATNPETTTFSGTVTLEGETDFSGVKVSLYKPVELDTALVRINQQYPNISVQISQETEFDYRSPREINDTNFIKRGIDLLFHRGKHTPSYLTTITTTNSAWKIEGVTPGTYNVVTEKDSYLLGKFI